MTFQRIAIPSSQVRCRLICCLQKVEKRPIRRFRLTYGVVGKDESAEVRGVKRLARFDWYFRKTIRLGIAVGIEAGIRNRAAAGPKPAATDFMRVRLPRHSVW